MSRWVPALRKTAIGAAIAFLLFGAVGYFAIPKLARWGVETVASRELGRTVRVESISANPYTLRVTLRGLVVEGSGEPAPLLTVREITANASVGSILRLAPVLDALTVDGLTANIVRLEPQRFNFSDVVDRIRDKPRTSDEPARFALYNIEVTDSTINFDDRPIGRKHLLSELRIGIPFISNLPTDAEIKVQPAFFARLNGSPIDIKGETRPFHETLETSIDLKFDGVDIPTYLAYLPVRLNFAIPRGTLSTDLRLAFRRAAPAQREQPARPEQTLVTGSFDISDFALIAPAISPQPMLVWKSLRVTLDEVEPLARRAVIGDIALVAPTVEVVRDAAGAINWVRLGKQPLQEMPGPAATAASSAEATPLPASAPLPPPFALTLKHAAVSEGTINVADDSAGRFRLQVIHLAAEASGLTNTSSVRGKLTVAGDIADDAGSVKLDGEVGLVPVGGRLALAAQNVKMRTAARYLAHVVNATLDGSSDVNAILEFAAADPAMKIALREIAMRSKDIRVRGPAGSGASFDIDAMSIDGAELDLTARQMTVARLSVDGPRAMVRRMADGQINWLTVFRAKPGAPPGTTEKHDDAAAAQPWKVLLKEAAITRGDLQFEDQSVDPNVKLRAAAITGTVSNVVSDGTQRAEIALRTRFGSGGTLAVNGGARWNPVASDLRVDARSLDIAVVRPYLAARLNAVLANALLSARGNAAVSQAATGAPLKVAYKGNARLANLHVLDARGEDDLLKWQVLDLEQIDAKGGELPPEVTVGKVALSDFYARVIVSAQGRLNLADLVKREGQVESTTSPTTKAKSEAATTPAQASMPVDRELAGNDVAKPAAPGRTAEAAVTPQGADPAAPRPVIRIGQIEITRGNVNFTDNFIKPNYTANMTGLGGTVTALASDSTEPATLALAGKIDDDAPVDISGRLNPLAPKLFLDIEGRTKGVDLPRLTPYSVKYAGYPIVKGKLSMEVKYKVEDEKLTANNHLFLDQLTFGEKVDSPTATKLPVLLAVSLLTNSRGEIDINLPISGTLNDPKFSVGGIIIQVIINLLTKVVTAPFSLLAAAFGGGEELGVVEFTAGSAALAPEQAKRVDTLAKALNDRPALKLDIIGRVDPALDTDGVKRAKYDSKLRAAKVRQRVRAGGESIDPSAVTITSEERPALIASVYSDEDIPDKPRNVIGIARTIPAPEMEVLILAHLSVTPEDLRALANQRATAVRNRLEIDGKVARERLFLVEPKLTPAGIQDKGATTRVDFSLK